MELPERKRTKEPSVGLLRSKESEVEEVSFEKLPPD